MFRYEIGAEILVGRHDNLEHEPTLVKILDKAPNTIKVEILSDGWFRRGEIRILTDDKWFTLKRMGNPLSL